MLLAKRLLGVASVTESKTVPLSIRLLKGEAPKIPSLGAHTSLQRAPEEGMSCKCSQDAVQG